MAELNNYKECREYLDKGKNRKNTMNRPIANSTRIIQINDDTIGIRLHNTFIVKYHDNSHLDCIDYGDLVQFDTGNWFTVTTKERMNRFAPVSIWSDRGIWYISKNYDWEWKQRNPDKDNPIYHFENNIFFKVNGNKAYRKEKGQLVELKPYSKKEEQATRKKLNQINTFVKNYVNKLMNGKMDQPSEGDCWFCLGESNKEFAKKMFTGKLKNGQLEIKQEIHPYHLWEHVKEKYYVPSLIWSAIRSECYDTTGEWGNPNMINGMSPNDKQNISAWFNPNIECHQFALDLTERRIKKIIKNYIVKRLGIA